MLTLLAQAICRVTRSRSETSLTCSIDLAGSPRSRSSPHMALSSTTLWKKVAVPLRTCRALRSRVAASVSCNNTSSIFPAEAHHSQIWKSPVYRTNRRRIGTEVQTEAGGVKGLVEATSSRTGTTIDQVATIPRAATTTARGTTATVVSGAATTTPAGREGAHARLTMDATTRTTGGGAQARTANPDTRASSICRAGMERMCRMCSSSRNQASTPSS